MADPRTCTNIQTVENPTHGGTWTRSDGSIGQDEQRWEHFYGDDMLIVLLGKECLLKELNQTALKFSITELFLIPEAPYREYLLPLTSAAISHGLGH